VLKQRAWEYGDTFSVGQEDRYRCPVLRVANLTSATMVGVERENFEHFEALDCRKLTPGSFPPSAPPPSCTPMGMCESEKHNSIRETCFFKIYLIMHVKGKE
jgi:hypothetical protein